jgi:hypothetical protein
MLEQELVPVIEEEVVVKAAFDPTKKSFSMAEVAEHVDRESAWFVVNDKVISKIITCLFRRIYVFYVRIK